jgi:hypothetical protein
MNKIHFSEIEVLLRRLRWHTESVSLSAAVEYAGYTPSMFYHWQKKGFVYPHVKFAILYAIEHN